MPIYLDRHDAGETNADEVAELHRRDLDIQDQYGVKFLTYWFDADRHTTFCLVDAPNRKMVETVHAAAHGHVNHQIIDVDLSAVEAFLGRIQDPPAADTVPISETAFRAIMFTDIVGSTEMTARLGDQRAVELLRAHDAIIRRALEKHRGAEVKHLGDGIMASFGDVPDSVDCGLQIQTAFKAHNAAGDLPIQVRIGIHAGEPVEESDDLFGSAVQLASRICDAADAESVLVSREVKDACAGTALSFARMDEKRLKGFAEPVALYAPSG